jgi:ABC-type nitrate/sulfonate/bicarbonate transport system substrate-binding protein
MYWQLDALSAVFLADLGANAQDIIRSRYHELANIDVLKVAHHGSADTSTELTAQLRPRIALIGVGADNGYGHPTRSALDALSAVGAVIARTDAGIMSPADLAGKRVGTPGQYGSGYLTLLGILSEASLGIGDVSLDLYPDYGQTQALISGAADATTGYANNDLVQAKAAGVEVEVFYASAAAPFAGPGLISSPSTIESKRDAIRAFIAATLEAMRQIAANPELGVDAAAKVVPEVAATPTARANSLAVMKATVDVWAGPLQQSAGYGAISVEAWDTSISFMRSVPGQQVLDGLKASDIVDESLLP